MSQDLFLVVALGFLIVMMFLSSRKRKKAAADLQSNLQVGSTVLLHSGILGTVVEIKDDKLVLESTPGTKLQVVKGAVRSVEAAPAKPAAKKTADVKPAAKKPVAKKPAAKPAVKPAAKN
jgi:preprotein translocase subunit YajC